jgi:hypothetical protein
MLITCRRCKKDRQSYVRHLCKLCYDALKKQEKRGSVRFDKDLLYPQTCGVTDCKAFAGKRPGLPMCEEHHELYYHTTGHLEDFNCQCSLHSAARVTEN